MLLLWGSGASLSAVAAALLRGYRRVVLQYLIVLTRNECCTFLLPACLPGRGSIAVVARSDLQGLCMRVSLPCAADVLAVVG